QLVSIFVPWRYRLTNAGSVNACHTASTEALIVMRFSATNFPVIPASFSGRPAAHTGNILRLANLLGALATGLTDGVNDATSAAAQLGGGSVKLRRSDRRGLRPQWSRVYRTATAVRGRIP